MAVMSILRQLYSLDTLDTRFSTSSTTPPKADGNAPEARSLEKNNDTSGLPPGASPSRWNTPEFYLYALVHLLVVPSMFKAVIDVSQPTDPRYFKFSERLSSGWIPGRKVDNSDSQYAGFRDNIPYMALVVVLHPLLRRAYDSVLGQNNSAASVANGSADHLPKTATGDVRLEQRTSYDLYFALLFVSVLHGFSAVKILFILYLNFNLAMCLPKHMIPLATWIFNVGVLFANELAHGYSFSTISENVLPLPMAVVWSKSMDSFGGLIPRWEILFNITVLRLIAFNMDYYWSLDRDRAGSPIEKQLDPASLSERDRVSIPAPISNFTSFRTYLAYVLYSPLYLTGPIINFNDYVAQSRYPSPTLTTHRTVLYGIRFVLGLLCMELLLHYIYVVAISHSNPDWSTYTPFQLSMLAFFNLHIIWLKLLLPWRFFRLWSLIDGIDPPENVVRCMSDNYSAFAFWRGWHRSFNRWIVRYIYVPLGGGAGGGVSKVRGIVNMLAVFTFVALWHDINLRLLMWGWLITLFVLPETLATMAFPRRKWKDWPNAYRVLCGIGAVFNILMMMAANLVGFAVGIDGLKGLVQGITGSWQGLAFLGAACSALFVGVQVMFEVREGELRQGIRMKC